MSDNAFWITFWGIVVLGYCLCICVPVYVKEKTNIEMGKLGYTEKIVLLRPATNWSSATYDRVWVKGTEPAIIEVK